MDGERSTGITVFGWLLVVLGVLMFFSTLDIRSQFEVYRSFPRGATIGLIVYGAISSIISVIAGRGVLKLKEVMRKVAVGINIVDLAIGIPVFPLSLPGLRRYAYEVLNRDPAVSGLNIDINILATCAFYFAVIISLALFVFSVLVIYFFTRPEVKEQFK